PAAPAAQPPASSVASAVAAAVAAATAGGGADAAAPAGPPLSAGEQDALRRAIGSKWNLGSASTEAMRTIVTVRVSFGRDGRPGEITLVDSDGPSDTATRTAFDAARRAIQRAWIDGQLSLPPEKYETWKVVEIVFNPEGMRFR
ncbi:MAG: hypothetical protein IE927_15045, partial [Rhodobacterales bacterium]|nr:hypothetical protein [Rhodobacterales bacterium]